MQSMVISGVIIMLVIGVILRVWRMVIQLATTVFFFALGVIVIGFLFGGVDAFEPGSIAEWTSILDILLGGGVGERVVDAVVTFVQSTF